MLNTSFSNKTQLKIKKLIFLFYWVGPGSMHLYLDHTAVLNNLHCSLSMTEKKEKQLRAAFNDTTFQT